MLCLHGLASRNAECALFPAVRRAGCFGRDAGGDAAVLYGIRCEERRAMDMVHP